LFSTKKAAFKRAARQSLACLCRFFAIIGFVELFTFKFRVKRERFPAVAAHIDPAEHFRLFAAARTDDLYGFGRQHPDPEVYDGARDDAEKPENHEDDHHDRMLLKEDTELHYNKSDEDQCQGKGPDPVDFILIWFHVSTFLLISRLLYHISPVPFPVRTTQD